MVFPIIIIKGMYENSCKGGVFMKKLFAMAITALGVMVAGAASTGCIIAVIDEPEMPRSMIER